MIDAGNLAAFSVLDGVQSVTVCVDHDRAGLAAYEALAARWTGISGAKGRVEAHLGPAANGPSIHAAN